MFRVSTRHLFNTLICAVALGLFAASPALAQAPPCPPERYAELTEAVEQVDQPRDEPELEFISPDGSTTPPPPQEPMATRLDFAAMGVSHTCELNQGNTAALEAAYEAPPEFRSVAIMRGVTGDMRPLIAACGLGAPQLLSDAATQAPPEREQAFVDGCAAFERLAPSDVLAGLDFDRLVLAAGVFGDLEMRGEPHAQELARLLLGLGLTTYTPAAP